MQTKEKINRSFWERDQCKQSYDYVVIGAGLVGSTAALTIRDTDPSATICIIDKHSIPTGASSRNAGFACFGSVTELLDDLTRQTEEQTKNLLRYRWEGLQKLRSRLSDDVLEYQALGGVEILDPHNEEYNQACLEQIDYLNELVYDAIGLQDTFKISTAYNGFVNVASAKIVNQYEGQIHPGKMMEHIHQLLGDQNIDLYFGRSIQCFEENSHDVRIDLTDGSVITCDQLLLATNAFSKDLLPSIDLTPGRNQVMMTKPIAGLDIEGCFHYDKGYVYFRNYRDRILIGGGRNMDQKENTTSFGLTDTIQNYLLSIMDTIILPNTPYEIDCWWSGIIAFSGVKSPIIKKYSPRINMGVRLGGMGVAIGSLVGEKLANLAIS